MDILRTIKTLGQTTLDLVFPVCCIVCRKEGAFLCLNCHNSLPRITAQQCIACQRPSPFGKTHPECLTRNTVDGLVCALPYQNPEIEHLIGIYKYKFVKNLNPQLTNFLTQEIKNQNLEDYFSNFTIVPVPLHRRRFEWRGFNQALLISQELSRRFDLPIDENLVTRIKNTKPQTKFNREERKKNIENAFGLNPSGSVEGRKFLLIDDVVTSGSTTNELAKLLKKHKASEVWAAAVAHG